MCSSKSLNYAFLYGDHFVEEKKEEQKRTIMEFFHPSKDSASIDQEWFQKNKKNMKVLFESNERGVNSYYYHTPTKLVYTIQSSCWAPPYYFIVSKLTPEGSREIIEKYSKNKTKVRSSH